MGTKQSKKINRNYYSKVDTYSADDKRYIGVDSKAKNIKVNYANTNNVINKHQNKLINRDVIRKKAIIDNKYLFSCSTKPIDDSYDSLSQTEKLKYISRSNMMKKYKIKKTEINIIPFIKMIKNKQPVYLYKLDDIDKFIQKNPREYTKNKALTIYQLDGKDIQHVPYIKRGIINYYKTTDLDACCIAKYGFENFEKIIKDGNVQHVKHVKDVKKRESKRKDEMFKRHMNKKSSRSSRSSRGDNMKYMANTVIYGLAFASSM